MSKRLLYELIMASVVVSMIVLGSGVRPARASWTIGVKTGDWMKLGYSLIGVPSGTVVLPEWIRVEFLSVVGMQATVNETIHMSDGTEQSMTTSGDIMSGDLVFVLPANMMTGDSINLDGIGVVVITGETTGTYVGASRAVFYANFSQYGFQYSYVWDKQTGIIVEASEASVSPSLNVNIKALETNMWSPAVPVAVDIQPVCLNLGGRGRWITARIELPEGYAAGDVDVSSLSLNDTVPAEKSASSNANVLVAKFDRSAVSKLILSAGAMTGNVTLVASGRLANGTIFAGSDSVRVRMPGDINMDGKVDSKDIAIVAYSFGRTSSDPKWKPITDENEDGKIDSKDIALVAMNFGKAYK